MKRPARKAAWSLLALLALCPAVPRQACAAGEFRFKVDLEAKRRSRPGWVRTGVVQLMLIVRLPGTTGERPLPGGRSPELH